MHIESIAELLPLIQAAGTMAFKLQRSGSLEKRIKGDGTIVTQADTQVEDYLLPQLSSLFPQANILTEETTLSFDPTKPYTFALDPIDGTEVFSRGMAGWCVSLGLLDQNLAPIAGIIFSPTMDLMIFADVGATPTVNGIPAETATIELPFTSNTNIMVTSKIHHYLELRRFPGKIRSLGSAELHLCFPVVYPDIVAGFQMPYAYIWDIAAAHAISRAVGYHLEYFDGREIDYTGMARGSMAEDLIVSGPEPVIRVLRETLPRL